MKPLNISNWKNNSRQFIQIFHDERSLHWHRDKTKNAIKQIFDIKSVSHDFNSGMKINQNRTKNNNIKAFFVEKDLQSEKFRNIFSVYNHSPSVSPTRSNFKILIDIRQYGWWFEVTLHDRLLSYCSRAFTLLRHFSNTNRNRSF